ncbi:MAG: SIS domain-containing protein, partial [Candidatus Hodarchaeota archaeon]
QVTNLTAIANELHERALIWPSAPINPSSIAKRIENHVPLFVGWKHLAPVAYRAKCQINENAKSISMSSELPEANHNEIESIESFSKFSIRPIILRSSHEDERTRKRFKITSDLLKEAGCEVINISLESGDTLMESLAFTYFLDLMSIELAELHQVDPVSVLRISELKRRLNS